jgi:putative ATPase
MNLDAGWSRQTWGVSGELFPDMENPPDTGDRDMPDRGAPDRSAPDRSAPLAARMRPRSLEEFVGQEHVVGPGSPLRALIETDRLSSVILWGPPGTGKTSLAAIIAMATRAHYVEVTAVSAGVADVRNAIAQGKEMLKANRRTILFIDEIHRFNKSQQDALLKAVESGWVVLIGATTENPFFEVNSPLLSRSLLFRLESLTPAQVRAVVDRALADGDRGVAASGVKFEPEALDRIVDMAGGDARFALNAVEVCVSAAMASGVSAVEADDVNAALQRRVLRYDKAGDAHYDVISAFIKSMRGTDPDAAVFWLAQMLEAGEDPEFIARRMVIFASEDVGNADPMALVVAVAAFDALRVVGLPEASLNLAQAATYLASAVKSNASTVALTRARADLTDEGQQIPPMHLRDASYMGAKRLGHGKGYQYPHSFPGGWVDQDYLPERLPGQPYYEPTERGAETEIGERLRSIRTRKSKKPEK